MNTKQQWMLYAGLAATSLARLGLAQAPGELSAVVPADCDRACLVGLAGTYMDGLVHHDPARVPFAKKARFSENDVLLPIGHEGLWASVSGAAQSALIAADTQTGNVAWLGVVQEYGVPAYYGMRLQVRGRQITEIETVIERKPGLPAPFGDPEKLIHDRAFNEPLAADERRGRERLRDVANGYFSTVSRNDGEVLTPFDADCQRLENGVNTTAGGSGAAVIAQGCETQFRLGLYRINKRVRERRYPIIDEERGVVVATGFFDHDNSFDHYQTTDGKERQTLLKWPNSLSLIEAFKIRSGKVYRVETVFTYVPYFMHSPWVESNAAEVQLAAGGSRLAAPVSCDRACLTGIADDYMAALVAHDPIRLPWGARVRYSENSISMMIGDGQWGSVTAKSATALRVADVSTGNVAWLGMVEEHGQPAFYGMRLKVADGRITEVEVVVRGQGEVGPWADPKLYTHDPAFEQSLAAGERRSREDLVALANGYFSTLEQNDGRIRTRFDPDCARTENGAATTRGNYGYAAISQGCESQFKLGLYRYDDRVRARRFEVVDVERGIVVATGFIDHGAHFVKFKTTDGQERDAPFTSPNSLGLFEVFKIRKSGIYRIEAIFSSLPYGIPSPWDSRPGSLLVPIDKHN